MKAIYMYGAGDVRTVEVPDPVLAEPTDAIIRIARTCVCGSDLWPYADMAPTGDGQSMGHEAVGVVEDIGAGVASLRRGDFVVMPMFSADGTCAFCREGVLSGCEHIGFFGRMGYPGAQAEAVRVPYADATLVRVGVAPDDDLVPSLLTLSDVMATGHHAAVVAGVRPGQSVAVIGDGAVGLCGVIAAKRLGAERIIVLGRHDSRTELAREFGATDVVAERGEEAVERVRELTGGRGAHAVLECVGTEQAITTAIEAVRPGGGVGRVGVPHYPAVPLAMAAWVKNVRVGGGPTPVRGYIDELLPDVLDGSIRPGRVFDRTVDLDRVPDAYQAMADRKALKVLIEP
ncbi:zinc-binding dehydrogenase [Dactylosporangium sp. CA-092794]|uniref:zinc-binding dehydrogenase n=1 Tax=Dactylosporangium sp. CA-092794 TaxID=3239929 RepID=UPI003D929FBD